MKHLFVANWKMNLPFNEAIDFCQQHATALAELCLTKECELVLCPSFEALHTVATILQKTQIAVGAQDVSRHATGAYTGEVSATSLAQAGCSYCIIGHSERRHYYQERTIDIEHKLKECIKNGITPIICIGETEQERNEGNTLDILNEQLIPLLQTIAQQDNAMPYVVAYEPVWAIGTGVVPTPEALNEVFKWLHTTCNTETGSSFRLLYGGGVDEKSAHGLRHISHLNGFLIGGASTSFERLKKVVQYD